MDVNKRLRLSEQLKVEKELFPDCIQAPNTYANRRKSCNISLKTKENKRPSYPGEKTSPAKQSKMEKTTYVRNWLERNENSIENCPRRPLADLNCLNKTFKKKVTKKDTTMKKSSQIKTSTPIKSSDRIKRRVDLMMDKVHGNVENLITTGSRKRSHFKTTLSMIENQSQLDNFLEPINKDTFGSRLKKTKSEFDNFEEIKSGLAMNDKDESGIEIDEPIEIYDSQSVVSNSQSLLDKDKLAWLAVLEADKNERNHVKLECSEIVKYTEEVEKSMSNTLDLHMNKPNFKVPFYRKSFLTDPCKLCVEKGNVKKVKTEPPDHSKDVSITIESNSFITTIKMSRMNCQPKYNTSSVEVQTDMHSLEDQYKSSKPILDEKIHHSDSMRKFGFKKEIMYSQDIFTGDVKTFEENNQKEEMVISEPNNAQNKVKQMIIVGDSDSDEELNQSSVIEVTADVHKSNNELEYGVLTELDQDYLQNRQIRAPRGWTPASTDSSDKENFDPNRQRRAKFGKKETVKKGSKKKLSRLR